MSMEDYNFQKPQNPPAITFFGIFCTQKTKVMEITKDGIWVNPDVSVDDTAKTVINALEGYIKTLVERVKQEEREACAKLLDGEVWAYDYREIASAIRARGGK